jgi:thiosulfate reductase cytochrome b subunit
VQRLLYAGVIAVAIIAVSSGLSLWKPVQFGWLSGFYGGYPVARAVHFFAMALIMSFVVVHVVLVALYPKTLVSMIAGVPADTSP